MSSEIIIFLISLAVVLGSLGLGWLFGGAGIVRYLLASLFAVLLALRYWYPACQAIGSDVAIPAFYLAGGLFVSLFITGFVVAGVAVRFKATRFRSVLSDPLDKTLGVLFGLAMGILLGGALLLDLSFFCAGAKPEFDAAHFPVRLDQAPVKVFQVIETNFAGVPDNAKTLIPVLKIDSSGTESHVVLAWD